VWNNQTIRGIARSLRDDGEYEDIRISHPTDDLLDELESLVCKQDLVETLNDVVPCWDEDDAESDDSDDDSDGEEE